MLAILGCFLAFLGLVMLGVALFLWKQGDADFYFDVAKKIKATVAGGDVQERPDIIHVGYADTFPVRRNSVPKRGDRSAETRY